MGDRGQGSRHELGGGEPDLAGGRLDRAGHLRRARDSPRRAIGPVPMTSRRTRRISRTWRGGKSAM